VITSHVDRIMVLSSHKDVEKEKRGTLNNTQNLRLKFISKVKICIYLFLIRSFLNCTTICDNCNSGLLLLGSITHLNYIY